MTTMTESAKYEKKCVIMVRLLQAEYPTQRIGLMMNGVNDWSIYFASNNSSITLPRDSDSISWIDLKRMVKVQFETPALNKVPNCRICSFNLLSTAISCQCSGRVCVPCYKSVVIARKRGFKCPYCNRANNGRLTPTEMNELFADIDRRVGLIPN